MRRREPPSTAFASVHAALRALAAVALLGAGAAVLGACAGTGGGPGAPAARDARPLDGAVDALVAQAFAGLDRPPPPGATPRTVVIDPLIDRATGQETAATRAVGARIAANLRARYPGVRVKAFTVAALDEQPLVLLGAVTSVAAPGSLANAPASSPTWRMWAVLGDLRTGRVLAHPNVWVQGATVDATPAPFAVESPVWTDEPMTAAYLRTCARNPGEAMDPVYLASLRAQAATAEATVAYERGRYADALALYRVAAATGGPGGEQQRVLNGLYLANWALGRRRAAEEAFGRLVDHGLAQDRLAVKLLFRPATTEFVRDPGVGAAYPMWLRQIAGRVDSRAACVRVTGHASVTGLAAANDRLSHARAERVRARLVAQRPPLAARARADGRGSREPIVGSGTDDMRDALDRRVEFAPLPCANMTAGGPPTAGG